MPSLRNLCAFITFDLLFDKIDKGYNSSHAMHPAHGYTHVLSNYHQIYLSCYSRNYTVFTKEN